MVIIVLIWLASNLPPPKRSSSYMNSTSFSQETKGFGFAQAGRNDMQLHQIRNKSGMTLGEVIVAVAIGLIVLGLMYGAFNTTFRLGKKGLSQIERLEEARLAMDQITRDLSGAISFVRDKDGNVLFQGKKGDIPDLNSDSLLLEGVQSRHNPTAASYRRLHLAVPGMVLD